MLKAKKIDEHGPLHFYYFQIILNEFDWF